MVTLGVFLDLPKLAFFIDLPSVSIRLKYGLGPTKGSGVWVQKIEGIYIILFLGITLGQLQGYVVFQQSNLPLISELGK